MVPHFVTALTGPLLELERQLLDATPRIERWFRLEWQEHTPPFYCSVDLRNAGFKLSPVDTNLYPGGFNNLSAEAMPLAVQAATVAIEKYCPDAKNLLLIPENHTRNTYYLQNVVRIAAMLRQTGLTVRLGTLNPEITAPTPVELGDGHVLMVEPLVRANGRVGLDGFDPCAILLNNDLSAGIPEILKDLQGQIRLPPLPAGWAVRRKSNHFDAFNDVAKRFAKLIDVDPWLLNPYFSTCGKVDFQAREGEECLANNVEATLKLIRAKYKEYKIDATPFVIVKADAGTYGMGIMSVKDAAEVQNLNRRQRNKMAVVKEGLEVSEVIIQEGVPTIETVENGVAEPVVYMVDKYVVGGFYRVHAERGRDENLNAPGSRFVPLPFASSCNLPDAAGTPECAPNRFYAYGVVARLALLAASLELERTDPDPSRFG
jgi:glutamate--cysteine ligase